MASLGAARGVLVAALFVNPSQDNSAQGKTDSAAVKKQVQNASKALEVKLAEKREEARKQGLKDAENLFKQLQAASDLRDPKLEGDKRAAMLKLNDLAEKLAKRSRELGGTEAVEKQLAAQEL